MKSWTTILIVCISSNLYYTFFHYKQYRKFQSANSKLQEIFTLASKENEVLAACAKLIQIETLKLEPNSMLQIAQVVGVPDDVQVNELADILAIRIHDLKVKGGLA